NEAPVRSARLLVLIKQVVQVSRSFGIATFGRLATQSQERWTADRARSRSVTVSAPLHRLRRRLHALGGLRRKVKRSTIRTQVGCLVYPAIGVRSLSIVQSQQRGAAVSARLGLKLLDSCQDLVGRDGHRFFRLHRPGDRLGYRGSLLQRGTAHPAKAVIRRVFACTLGTAHKSSCSGQFI